MIAISLFVVLFGLFLTFIGIEISLSLFENRYYGIILSLLGLFIIIIGIMLVA